MGEIRSLRANGKLLISGEYLVLLGARALAFPLKFGQTLRIYSTDNTSISWRSDNPTGNWFSSEIDPITFSTLQTAYPETSHYLEKVLKATRQLNPCFQPGPARVNAIANYPVQWGLGSSATLIALVAEWANVDKFNLFRLLSNGSGYDVACTDQERLIFFQLVDNNPVMETASPGEALRENTCFAYLGVKQETTSEVSAFLEKKRAGQADIERISTLSTTIATEDDPVSFCSMLEEHEVIMSNILQKERVQNRFPGFNGVVKSLGAWGGDFGMFSSAMGNEKIKVWLRENGLRDIFTFDELKINP